MAEKEVQAKLRLRTDSAGNWLKANPVLLLGEVGIESDTGKVKIGNGTATWRELPYYFVLKNEILDCVYPVNSVMISKVNENPGITLGGLWERTEAENTTLYYWVRKG